MIQASELRIGNWINLSLREDISIYGKVLSIGSLEQEFEQVYCECEESFEWAFKDNYTGIPLTPEIMDKIGSRRSSLGATNVFWSVGEYGFLYSLEDIELQKGLHWFQNFHYFRTGEELQYNPQPK